MERRGVRIGDTLTRHLRVDLRATKDDDGIPRIAGTAAPYESETTLFAGRFFTDKETYGRGCFRESVNDPQNDLLAYFNHSADAPLGRRSNDSLTVTEDDAGVHFDVRIDPEDPEAMRVWRLCERRTVFGSSTRFRVLEGEETIETRPGDHKIYRYRIIKADLRELGPVTEPAYPDATSEARYRRTEAAASYADFLRSIKTPTEEAAR